jgi:DNA-binding NarL/FixJ family response regulator
MNEVELEVGFTQKEMDILLLLNCGFKNREIAEAMKVSCRTIEAHIFNMTKKLRKHGLHWGKVMVRRNES